MLLVGGIQKLPILARSGDTCRADTAASACHNSRRGTIRGGAISELPRLVVTPTAGGPVGHQRACMANSSVDTSRVGKSRNRHGSGPIGGSAVAELAECIAAPAACGPVVE